MGRNRDHMGDTSAPSTRDNVIQFIAEIGKVQMAMAVDQGASKAGAWCLSLMPDMLSLAT